MCDFFMQLFQNIFILYVHIVALEFLSEKYHVIEVSLGFFKAEKCNELISSQ